jgi:hypothetical protein
MTTNPNTTPRLNCEVLEPRDNPAGNVSVAISGGVIIVAGDAFNNRINLSQDSVGNVFITGLDNTTVNGQSSLFLGRGIPNGVRIDLAGGNDRAEVVGLVTFGDLIVGGNVGNDQTIILSTAAQFSVQVHGQDGDDDTYLSNISADIVWLDGGNGFDVAHADNIFTNRGIWVWNHERLW